tara:strand:- start:551 stop:736 length:186 start_codon:yes stop_codon:yes gene_type:complete
VNDDYIGSPDAIHEGHWVDESIDKWVKICRALKEAGKTDSYYYKQGQSIVGKEKLEELLNV